MALCKLGSNTFNSALMNTIKAMLEGQHPHTTTDKVLSTEPLVPLNEAKQKPSVVTKETVREYCACICYGLKQFDVKSSQCQTWGGVHLKRSKEA